MVIFIRHSKVDEKTINVKDFGAKGDGSLAHIQIQAALNKAESTGMEVVYFPKGIYLLDVGLIIPSNVTLKFEKGAILKRNAPFTTMMVTKSDGTVGGYDAVKNIKIIGGRFEPGVSTEKMTTIAIGHASDIEIRDCEFDGNREWHFCDITGSRRVKLIANKFLNYGTASTGIESVQLDVFMPDSTGNFPWYGPYDKTACEDILIEGNVFLNGNTAIGSHSATPNVFHKNIRILKNTFVGHRLEVISGLAWQDVIIKDNYIEDAYGGIKMYCLAANTSTKNIKIHNNTLKNIKRNATTSRGIYLVGLKNGSVIEDISILDNYVEDVTLHGISFDFVKSVTVRGNNVKGCGQAGVYSYGSSDVLVQGNRLKGNATAAVGVRHDINIGYVTDLKGARNLVSGNFVESIGIYYSQDCVVERNYFTKVGGTVTDAGGNTNLVTELNRAATV